MLIIYECENLREIRKCMGEFTEKIGGIYGDVQHIVYKAPEMKKYNYSYFDMDYFEDMAERRNYDVKVVRLENKLYAMKLDDVEQLASVRGIVPILSELGEELVHVDGFSRKVRRSALEHFNEFANKSYQPLRNDVRDIIIALAEAHAGQANTIEPENISAAIKDITTVARAYRQR